MSALQAPIVTGTRVIFADETPPQVLIAARMDFPGKTICYASALQMFASEPDSKTAAQVASLTRRLADLEKTMQGLQAGNGPRIMDVSAETPAPSPAPVITNAPKPAPVELIVKDGKAIPKPVAETKAAAVAKVEKAKKVEASKDAAPRRKLSDLTYVELQARVTKRGGKLERILKNVVGGPARKKKLISWIVADKAKAK